MGYYFGNFDNLIVKISIIDTISKEIVFKNWLGFYEYLQREFEYFNYSLHYNRNAINLCYCLSAEIVTDTVTLLWRKKFRESLCLAFQAVS